MKLKNPAEELTPEAVQDIDAGLNPDQVYVVQRRNWTYWLLRGILAVTIVLGLFVLVGSFIFAK
jgi:hypothetical protein